MIKKSVQQEKVKTIQPDDQEESKGEKDKQTRTDTLLQPADFDEDLSEGDRQELEQILGRPIEK